MVRAAQIEINSADHLFLLPDEDKPASETTRYDLVAVVTHEMGHFIGLDHSRAAESIMAERYCEQPTRCSRPPIEARRLADDDVLAVCTLFPPDASATGDVASSEASSGGCNASGVAAATPYEAGLVLCAAVALLRRRRK